MGIRIWEALAMSEVSIQDTETDSDLEMTCKNTDLEDETGYGSGWESDWTSADDDDNDDDLDFQEGWGPWRIVMEHC